MTTWCDMIIGNSWHAEADHGCSMLWIWPLQWLIRQTHLSNGQTHLSN